MIRAADERSHSYVMVTTVNSGIVKPDKYPVGVRGGGF